jgi:hypothetical protein
MARIMWPPMLRVGNEGSSVVTVQTCLRARPIDGDFGPITEKAVKRFQQRQMLDVDGIVGDQTWAALERVYHLPPYPPPLPAPLDQATIDAITRTAMASRIARYDWQDRGGAPAGYTKGMAVAYSTVYRKWLANEPIVRQMARANTHNDDVDALAWYAGIFNHLGMRNEVDSVDTVRHLFVLLLGLGMRESSGRYCEGRDQSAENVEPDTAEAGLFQTSWNISSTTTDMEKLMDEYSVGTDPPQCLLSIFREGVDCDAQDFENFGGPSDQGYVYQGKAKSCPQFAVEMTALGLRKLRQHWGPINRQEAEVRREADEMFAAVQELVTPPSA